jgi:hypothetical protein
MTLPYTHLSLKNVKSHGSKNVRLYSVKHLQPPNIIDLLSCDIIYLRSIIIKNLKPPRGYTE